MSYLAIAKRKLAELEAARERSERSERSERRVPAPATPAPGAGLDREIVARLLAMPLDRFAREGQPVEVRVRWWPETLWFVPDVHDVAALCGEGIGRHRVWTAAELTALLAASPLTTTALATVMRARAAFDGEVVEVRPR